MNFYQDGLAPPQFEVLSKIAPFIAKRQFYLGGGTALAIFLRHRRSLDLGWFTQERLPDPLTLAQDLRESVISFPMPWSALPVAARLSMPAL